MNLPQQTIASRILILALLGIFIFRIKDKICFMRNEKYMYTKIVVSVLIFAFGLIKSTYPDNSFDIGKYHLIVQTSEFINWFKDYSDASDIKILCNNGEDDNDSGDWVIIKW